VLLLGLLGSVGFDPGVFAGGCAPVGGGVVLPVGGWPVLPVGACPVFPVGGVDGDVCPGVAVLPEGAVPPAGACCAITQVAHNRSTDSSMNFFAIRKVSSIEFVCSISTRAERAGMDSIAVCATNPRDNIRRRP